MAKTKAPSKETTKKVPAKVPAKAVAKRPARTHAAPIASGVGRRKSSVARVWLYRGGKGDLEVNGLPAQSYFDTEVARLEATAPIRVALPAELSMRANVSGGGLKGQAGAVSVGVARALVAFNDALKKVMREHGFLTVDSRVKERKKYGQKAARRKFQFVKR